MFGLLSEDCLQTNKALKAAALSPTPVAGKGAVTTSAVLTGAGRPHPVEEEEEEEGGCVCVRESMSVCVFVFLWYV